MISISTNSEAVRRNVVVPVHPLRTLVILPTYNEAENIAPLCEQLLALQPAVDVLIVDDGSPDGTGAVAKRLRNAHPTRVWLEERQGKLGRGDAVMHGFRFALSRDYAYVMEMDADGSHDPMAIPLFLAQAPTADLVIGSRHLPGGGVTGWNWRRRCIHALATLFSRVVLGTPTSDHTNGFRLYRLACLVDLPLESAMAHGFAGQTLRAFLFYKQGLRIREVPVVFHERRKGQSKMSWREAISGAWDILCYRLRIS